MKQRSLQCHFKQYWQSKKHNDSEKKPTKSCAVCLQFLYCSFFISVDVTDTLNLLVALPRKTIFLICNDFTWKTNNLMEYAEWNWLDRYPYWGSIVLFYQWLTFTCDHFLCWPSPSGHALRWRIVAISLFRGLLKEKNNSGVQAQVTKIFSYAKIPRICCWLIGKQ